MNTQALPFSDRITPRAKATMTRHADAAARELGQLHIDTAALLLGIWSEPNGLAALALANRGLDRGQTLAALEPLLPPGGAFEGGYTDVAWTALQLCWRAAVSLGHNYVGTEHLLIALLSLDADDAAPRALAALGVRVEDITAFVRAIINS
jgi:ATP-dependent Clp protease ATP-binding subunit ClpA